MLGLGKRLPLSRKLGGISYGPVLNVSNCVNGVTAPMDTFANGTPTGMDFIHSTPGTKSCGTADEIVYASGEIYFVEFDFVNNSGGGATFDLSAAIGSSSRSDEGLQLASVGANSFSFTSKYNGTGVVHFVMSNDGDNGVTNLQVRQIL